MVTLRGLSLNDVSATYDDEVTGLNLHFHLGVLKASIDRFDLEKNQFHVEEFSLENTTATVVQTRESPHEESPSAEVDFGLGSVSLANLHFSYENTVSHERYAVDLGTSALQAEKIDLPSHRIALTRSAFRSRT